MASGSASSIAMLPTDPAGGGSIGGNVRLSAVEQHNAINNMQASVNEQMQGTRTGATSRVIAGKPSPSSSLGSNRWRRMATPPSPVETFPCRSRVYPSMRPSGPTTFPHPTIRTTLRTTISNDRISARPREHCEPPRKTRKTCTTSSRRPCSRRCCTFCSRCPPPRSTRPSSYQECSTPTGT